MSGAGASKRLPRKGLLPTAFGRTGGGPFPDDCERAPVVAFRASSLAKNNQLRTGADKGNPTV